MAINNTFENKYYGKNFSILGDSISTFEGIIPNGYKSFYSKEKSDKNGISNCKECWWGRVVSFFGGNILANSSYSGSKVTSKNGSFPCINSDMRIDALSSNGVMPDVVIVYAGFNDWAKGMPLKAVNDGRVLTEFFDFSYLNMIIKITKKYPNAEIWCCTVCKTMMSSNPNFEFPIQRHGIQIDDFNDVVRNMATRDNCKVLDLYSYDVLIDTLDSSHPNADGMITLANLVCSSVVGDDVDCTKDSLIDDKNDEKQYCPNCNNVVQEGNKFCMSCGKRLVEDANSQNDEDQIDMIGDRYELMRQVGKGASSVVYLAKDIKLDRVCAVKIVKKDTYSNMMAAQESLDEVNKLKLLAHVSIPQLYDIYNDDKRLCIVMEFIDGKNLRQILNEATQPIDEKTIANWAKQLCRVLYYLHTLTPPRVYRDLKPANIILQSNGVIKLIDFGTMKNYDESETEDTVNLGTKGYAAPEQFGGRGATDARTDIYAFGMTLFHLITGISPAKAPYEIKPLRAYRQDVSEELEKIVSKCIEIEREKRYQSALEILMDLERT